MAGSKPGPRRNGKSPAGARGSEPPSGSEALEKAGARAAELAGNPVARSMLAAGLVSAAAMIAVSPKVRAGIRSAARDGLGAAEVAADHAARIGAQIVAAGSEAVSRLLGAEAGQDAAVPSVFDAGQPSAAARHYTIETLPEPSSAARAILDRIERSGPPPAAESPRASGNPPGDVRSLAPEDEGLRPVALGS